MDFDSFVTDFLTGREDPRAHGALEQLVDSLHSDRGAAISSFLSHPGSEDLLAALVGMLLSVSVRVSGNAAYALGILTETDAGFQRVYSLASKDKNNKDLMANGSSTTVLENLVDLLVSNDTESVMNIAGTLGTLAETQAGRRWMLESSCIDTLIDRISMLLQSDNTWTAGNSALVLARLSISEDGCIRLLQHNNYKTILDNLINSLGTAGRATNAAFAIGRICDQKTDYRALENHDGLEKMVSQLYKMLISDDVRWSKNACFALSSLAAKKWGQDKLLSSFHCSEILETFARLLFSEDHETGWFSAVALHTLASLPKGCLQIRKNISVETAMKKVIEVNPNAELKAEVTSALEFLKRLPKPKPPKVQSISASEIQVEWDLVTSKCGFPITYKVYKDDQCVFEGKDCLGFTIGSLQPETKYRIQLQTCAEEDNSPLSDAVTAVTIEEVPSPPLNLQIIGRTVNMLKVCWDPPKFSGGTIKFYHVFADIQDGTGNGHLFESTTAETSSIISGLTAGTTYNVQILASNSKGKGLPASILARTSEPGSHVPSKPNVTVIGRSELHVTWSTPAEPLGRINYYELSMDGNVVYSGNDMNFYIRRLTPDTEYNFAVSAVTTEGRFESKMAKKRTAKDEYETNNTKVLTTSAENSIAAEVPKLRPRTSLSRRCRSACVPLKSCQLSSKQKNITDEAPSTEKSSKPDSHPIKRASVHSAIHRHDCSQRRIIPVKYSKPGFTANNSTSQEGKQNGKSVLMSPNYINISLRGSNRTDTDRNATTTRTVSNGRLARTKTFVFGQSNRSPERQAEKSTNGVEAEVSSASTQDEYAFGKTADMKTTMESINSSGSPTGHSSGSPTMHTACRMWSVPSAIRSKSAIKRQPNKSGPAITSRCSNLLFRSSRESQVRSVFNSHRWLAMESRPCLELRVPVSTPETANTNSTSSRKSSSFSDTSSTEKKQVCFEDISKPDDPQISAHKEPPAREEPNQETISQSLQTLEIHETATNERTVPDSIGGIHMSAKDADPQNISYSKNSTDCEKGDKSREIVKRSYEIWDRHSKTDDRDNTNGDKSYQCKGSVDSDKESRTKTPGLEKDTGHDKSGHFLSSTASVLPFNENNQSKEKCWKTTESYSKRAKQRTVRSAKSLKFSRSASAPRRPGTVSISGSGHHQSAGASLVGKANTNEDSARFLGVRTMTLSPTLNMIGSRNNNSMFTEGFVPSQLRTQPCNLNMRQLQRIHTTLLGIRGDSDKLVIQTLLYQKNQDQQRNMTQTNRQLIQKSATAMRGSSHSYRNELIAGMSKIPLHHRSMRSDSILLRQTWT